MSSPQQPKPRTGECPVCGVSMEGRDPIGHAQVHFPDNPLPNRPETLIARQQQAQLLGRDIPKE